jgi:hypothetical protein
MDQHKMAADGGFSFQHKMIAAVVLQTNKFGHSSAFSS